MKDDVVHHFPPQDKDYRGSYVKLACCTQCRTLGLAQDVHTRKRGCVTCGSLTIVSDTIYGRWNKQHEGWVLTPHAVRVVMSVI